MSDTVTTDPTVVDEHASAEHDDEHHGEHASDLLYIKVAGILAVLTAMEVAWPYVTEHVIETDGPVHMWPLIVVMVIKFIMIGSFFMHLKFDSKILTRVFYSGLVLAVSVYIAALVTFSGGLNPFH